MLTLIYVFVNFNLIIRRIYAKCEFPRQWRKAGKHILVDPKDTVEEEKGRKEEGGVVTQGIVHRHLPLVFLYSCLPGGWKATGTTKQEM